jgi:hypothetical protein
LSARFAVLILFGSFIGAAANVSNAIYATAYSANGAATLYSISSRTATATAIGPIGFKQVSTITFAPNGTLYGVGRADNGKWTLLTIDPKSGSGTAVGAMGLSEPLDDIAFSADGSLFGYMRSDKDRRGLVYRIDTRTGTATLSGNILDAAEGNGPIALASENAMYAIQSGSLRSLGQGKHGAVTDLNYGAVPGKAPQANTVKFDSQSKTLWATVGAVDNANSTEYLAVIDTVSGDVKPIGKTVAGLHGLAFKPLAFEPPPTPIPSSLLLLIMGALALAIWQYRMRLKTAGPTS